MYKRQIILLIIIFLNFACTNKEKAESKSVMKVSSKKESNKTVSKKTYSKEEYGVSFEYPESWTGLENFKGNMVVLVPGEDSVENGEIEDYFNAKQEDLIKLNVDLKTYVEFIKSQLESKSEEIVFEEQNLYEKDGQEYIALKFSGKERGKRYQAVHLYTKRNDRAYIFAFMAQNKGYEKYREDVEKIFDSIKVEEVKRKVIDINPPISDFTLYENAEKGFSIKYPKDWKYLDSEKDGAAFTLYTPRESEYDEVWENISVNVDNLSEMGIYLEEYAELAYNNVRGLFKNELKLIDSQKINFNGHNALKVLYGVKKDNQELLFLQIYFINGSKGYVLNFSSTVETYSRYIAVTDKVFNSFELLDKESSIEDYQRAMLINFRKSDYKKVIDYADKIVEIDDKNLQAMIYRGEAYRAVGEIEKSKEDYKRIIATTDNELYLNKAYAGLGTVSFSEEDYEKSKEYFFEALEFKGDEDFINYMLANIFYKEKAYKESIKFYTDVIESRGEEYLEALLGRSDAYYSIKDYQNAYEDLTVIIDANPKSLYIATIYNNRACNLRYLGKAEKAMDDVKAALEKDPKNAYAYTTLAELYADMGDKEKFFENIKKAEDLDSTIIKNLEDYYDKEEPKLKILLDEYKKMYGN